MKKRWRVFFAAVSAAALLFVFFSCEQPAAKKTSYITLSARQLTFSSYAETQTVSIETDLAGLAVSVSTSGAGWCTAARLENGRLEVTVAVNEISNERSAVVTVSAGAAASATLAVTQAGISDPGTGTLGNDIKIPVASATASSYQSGEGIEKSYDGSMSTMYHSNYTTTSFPVTLTYNFSGAPSMDYLKYYARSSGSNGKFKELEIWVAHNGSSALQKYGDYNFNSTSALVNFEPPLVNPTQVQFKVQSGAGNFASCAEMEFYRKDSSGFDWLTVFTDNSCSALKAGVTRETIDSIPEPFFKDLALKLFLNRYDSEFRVQEYRAWPHPDAQADANKTAPYSLRDNPTGIYITQGKDVMVFVAALHGQNVSLLTQDLSTGSWGTQHTYPLSAGMNKITAQAGGLVYVQYYNEQGENAPKIKINFATGDVNGYFDSQKHETADWSRLLNNAVAADFDLVGEFAHLTFPVARFKTCTPDGKALIDEWDRLVKMEHEFMGLYKYNRVFKNRVYCHVDYTSDSTVHMYATSYHTGYALSSINPLLTLNTFKTSGVWGPAHEIGHVNQVRPGVKWTGMAEVTNNLYSLHVQTSFGNTSRLITDNVYTSAFNKLLDKNKPHNDTAGGFGVWEQLVPFWQLKLYLCDALGKTDFYKDLYYYYMTHADPGTQADTDGRYQLQFVRVACEIANLNLTGFFEKWGFLTPIDKELTDYGTTRFTITQAQIDALKAEIAAKNYPAPSRDFTGITDINVGTYN